MSAVGLSGEALLRNLDCPEIREYSLGDQEFTQFTGSMALKKNAIEELADIRSVVIVGSSGCGKTEIVELSWGMSENSSLLGLRPVAFPKRYITRQQRLNEDLRENMPVSSTEFDLLVSEGDIEVWWTRELSGDSQVKYGFEAAQPDILSVYSANNSIVSSPESAASSLVTRSLVLQVFAPEGVRRKRLVERSPDLSQEEIARRLKEIRR